MNLIFVTEHESVKKEFFDQCMVAICDGYFDVLRSSWT